jgi:septal ring factor EnvC (AmiA/AmiB activator)
MSILSMHPIGRKNKLSKIGVSCVQESIAGAEKELEQVRAQLAEEQAEAAARASAMAEESERLQAEARKLHEAKRAWSEGEQERRGAAALLEEARAEAARIKASIFPNSSLHFKKFQVLDCSSDHRYLARVWQLLHC